MAGETEEEGEKYAEIENLDRHRICSHSWNAVVIVIIISSDFIWCVNDILKKRALLKVALVNLPWLDSLRRNLGQRSGQSGMTGGDCSAFLLAVHSSS